MGGAETLRRNTDTGADWETPLGQCDHFSEIVDTLAREAEVAVNHIVEPGKRADTPRLIRLDRNLLEVFAVRGALCPPIPRGKRRSAYEQGLRRNRRGNPNADHTQQLVPRSAVEHRRRSLSVHGLLCADFPDLPALNPVRVGSTRSGHPLVSFNDLVGAGEQDRRDFKAERSGGLETDGGPHFVGAALVSRQGFSP